MHGHTNIHVKVFLVHVDTPTSNKRNGQNAGLGLNGGKTLADLDEPSVELGICCAREYGDSKIVSSEREDSFGTGAEVALLRCYARWLGINFGGSVEILRQHRNRRPI